MSSEERAPRRNNARRRPRARLGRAASFAIATFALAALVALLRGLFSPSAP